MSLNVNPLSLEEIKSIAEKDGSLYVINYTDRGRQRNRGIFHLQVIDESGESFAIVVPNTWIPVDLSMFCSIKQLVKSQSFLNAFRNTDLICISSGQAKQILDNPDAQSEAEKVALKYKLNVAAKPSISISTDSSISVNNLPSQPSSVEDEDTMTPSDEKLLGIVDSFNKNQVSDIDAVNQLKAINPPPRDNAIRESLMRISFTTSPFYITLSDLIGSRQEGDEEREGSDHPTATFHAST